jgi:fermentation-respiration switch protein FrsA (DUF1100 family)
MVEAGLDGWRTVYRPSRRNAWYDGDPGSAVRTIRRWPLPSGAAFIRSEATVLRAGAAHSTCKARNRARPLLMIVGREAVTAAMTTDAYAAAGEPKELHWIEGATHVGLYEVHAEAAVQQLAEFFIG